jgi:hypothetical protein
MKWKELEDYDWFPPILRRYQMQNIGIQVNMIGLYREVVPVINEILAEHEIYNITDLCSGSGLPAMYVRKKLNQPNIIFTLSDLYPQPFELTEGIEPQMETLDVLHFSPKPDVLYTMFNAFHHFEAHEQAALLQKIIDAKSSVIIVEILKPNLWNMVLVTLASTLGVWVFFGAIRPFEWRRFVLTYLIPINVLTVWWDGMISILKSKSAKTYRKELKTHLFEQSQDVEVFEIMSFPTTLTIIKITPKNQS